MASLLLLGGLVGACAQDGSLRQNPFRRSVYSTDIVGEMRSHRISAEETLLDVTRRYDLGYAELLAANPGVDPWVPGAGRSIVLPTAHLVPPGKRDGVLVNLAEQRLYVFEPGTDRVAASFPIGVSRVGWETPLGETKVVRKKEAPTWTPTRSARREDPTLPTVVKPGPENPLGTHALYLAWPQYLIHGTNEPDGVGRRVSRGCIRLYPEDIVRLFEMVPVQTRVAVIDQPVKLARIGGEIYLEVHPALEDLAELEEKGGLEPIRPADLRPQISAFAGADRERIDWRRAYQVAAERRGVPLRITSR